MAVYWPHGKFGSGRWHQFLLDIWTPIQKSGMATLSSMFRQIASIPTLPDGSSSTVNNGFPHSAFHKGVQKPACKHTSFPTHTRLERKKGNGFYGYIWVHISFYGFTSGHPLWIENFSVFLIFLDLLIVISIYVCLHVYMVAMCTPCAHRGQKRVPDPLQLQLWMAVGYHVHAGNRTWVLWKSSKCSSPPSHFPGPWSVSWFSHSELDIADST